MKEKFYMSFKKGDKVKLIASRFEDRDYNPIWDGLRGKMIGVIFDNHCGFYVTWSNGKSNIYREEDLALIEPIQKHHPLTKIFR